MEKLWVAVPRWEWTLPNVITFFRLVPAPLAMGILFAMNNMGLAFCVFVIACATDAVDGWIARRTKSKTAWGAFFDPGADKTICWSVFFILLQETSVAFVYIPPIIVIVVYDVLVIWMRLRSILVMKTRWSAKWKTMFLMVSQIAALFFVWIETTLPIGQFGLGLLLDLHAYAQFGSVVFLWIAACLAIISVHDYVRDNRESIGFLMGTKTS